MRRCQEKQVNKTAVIPLGYGGSRTGEGVEEVERDFLEVVIQKVAAHGDDGTNAGSSTRVWMSSFAIILYFCVGILFYVYHEEFTFIDALLAVCGNNYYSWCVRAIFSSLPNLLLSAAFDSRTSNNISERLPAHQYRFRRYQTDH